jgi:hypothetical protein
MATTALQMLQCPGEVGQFQLAPVTVYTDDTTGLARGQVWWFFARGWLAGHGLAVREVARFRGADVDSLIAEEYLGPDTFIGRLQRHLEDTISIVTGRVALDSMPAIPLRPPGADQPFWVTRPFRMMGSFTDSTYAPANVGVPISWLGSVPLLQTPDSAQHLVFFLHPTSTTPARLFLGGVPPWILRDADDVRPLADSAKVADGLRQLGTLPKGFLPMRLRHCGRIAP